MTAAASASSSAETVRKLMISMRDATRIMADAPDWQYDSIGIEKVLVKLLKEMKYVRELLEKRTSDTMEVAKLSAQLGRSRTYFIRLQFKLVLSALNELIANKDLFDNMTPQTVDMLTVPLRAAQSALQKLGTAMATASGTDASAALQLADSAYDPESRVNASKMPTALLDLVSKYVAPVKWVLPEGKVRFTSAALRLDSDHTFSTKTGEGGLSPMAKVYIDAHGSMVVSAGGIIIPHKGAACVLRKDSVVRLVFERPAMRQMGTESAYQKWIRTSYDLMASRQRKNLLLPFGNDELLELSLVKEKYSSNEMYAFRAVSAASEGKNIEPALLFDALGPYQIDIPSGDINALDRKLAVAGPSHRIVHILVRREPEVTSYVPTRTSPNEAVRLLNTYYIKTAEDGSTTLRPVAQAKVRQSTDRIVARGRHLAFVDLIMSTTPAITPTSVSLVPATSAVKFSSFVQPNESELLRSADAEPGQKLETYDIYAPVLKANIALNDISPDCRLVDFLVDENGHIAALLAWTADAPAGTGSTARRLYARIVKLSGTVDAPVQTTMIEWSEPDFPGTARPTRIVLGPSQQFLVRMLTPRTTRDNHASAFLVELTSDMVADRTYTVWNDPGAAARVELEIVGRTLGAGDKPPSYDQQKQTAKLLVGMRIGPDATRKMHAQIELLLTAIEEMASPGESSPTVDKLFVAAFTALAQMHTLAGLPRPRSQPTMDEVLHTRRRVEEMSTDAVAEEANALIDPLKDSLLSVLAAIRTASSNGRAYDISDDWIRGLVRPLLGFKAILIALAMPN